MVGQRRSLVACGTLAVGNLRLNRSEAEPMLTMAAYDAGRLQSDR